MCAWIIVNSGVAECISVLENESLMYYINVLDDDPTGVHGSWCATALFPSQNLGDRLLHRPSTATVQHQSQHILGPWTLLSHCASFCCERHASSRHTIAIVKLRPQPCVPFRRPAVAIQRHSESI